MGVKHNVTAEAALRFAAFQASECRERDAHEALCLLFPALLRVLELQPMNGYEAEAFQAEFKLLLTDFHYDPEPSTVGCP